MVEISASMVMKLRKISGQGMMDCKKALEEANGDADKAMDILRKKGLVTLSKRAARETSEGIVLGRVGEDGNVGTLAVLCCETDFSAKSNDFIAAAETLSEYAMKCPADEGVENILETSIDGKTFADVLTELVSKTGEKTQVGDFARFRLDGPGLVSVYVHFNQKVGSMLQIETSGDEVAKSDPVKRIAADIAMHITATNPLALDKDAIDPKIIEQEKAIYADQVKNKPPNIVDKIVEGKLRKFYAENCLLEQAFVKDDSKSVRQVLDEAAAQAAGQSNIKRCVRFAVG